MVDALASGASTGNGVEVRVLFWAPIFPNIDALKCSYSLSYCLVLGYHPDHS